LIKSLRINTNKNTIIPLLGRTSIPVVLSRLNTGVSRTSVGVRAGEIERNINGKVSPSHVSLI